MDSSSADVAVSVDSIANDLKNQSLGSDRGDSDDDNQSKRVRLKLEDLNWDHSFTRELPGDLNRFVSTRAWSEPVAELLDLDPTEFERPDFPLLFSGASSLVGAEITLGEILNSKSERWELQLKGTGKTPYSQSADGLAVLRSSIGEFLCSEAMHSLGIPTTRTLCLVTTGKLVTHDMFYDGNPKEEPGAIVCRVAQLFLGFGSYQIHASRGKEDLDVVRSLADYTIKHHFPHIDNINKSETLSFCIGDEDHSVVDLTSNKYAAWALELAERTAFLIASW